MAVTLIPTGKTLQTYHFDRDYDREYQHGKPATLLAGNPRANTLDLSARLQASASSTLKAISACTSHLSARTFL